MQRVNEKRPGHDTKSARAKDAQSNTSQELVLHRESAHAINGFLHMAPWVQPNRNYLIIAPDATAQQQPNKLLLLLHGCEQSIEDFASGSDIANMASQHG